MQVQAMSEENKWIQMFSEAVQQFLETSPFFAAWKPGRVNTDTAVTFLCNFNLLVGFFPRLIALGCASSQDEDMRTVLAVNLFQECGEGDVQRTHHAIYRKFLRTAGLDPNAKTEERFTDQWWTSMRGYLMEASSGMCALGALATGEFMAPSGLGKIFKVIQPLFPAADIEYFSTHLSMEVEHVREIGELLGRQVERGARPEDAIDGFRFGMKTWDCYFESLNNYLFSGAH